MTKPSVDVSVVVHALGEWITFDGPLFRKLAAGVERAVERGDLAHGRCLPSERTLAPQLSVSRGTVVAAYAVLAERGVVQRRPGSGTWVTGTASSPVVDNQHDAAAIRSRRLTSRAIPNGAVIDLGVSILLDTSLLSDSALAIDRSALDLTSLGHGYLPLGIPQLRQRLAELHTAAGLPTRADQIAVTNGAQHAIALTARLLVRPGDQVVVESPTYPGAIDAFIRAGAAMATVGTDGAGARVDAIAKAAGSSRLAYVMPSFHNPTGSAMSDGRRRDLAALADRTELWVIEDNSLAHLSYHQDPPPPVAAYARGERVISIGSLSKLVWGGLRVGWIRAHPSVINRIARLRAADDFGNAAPTQLMSLAALADAEPLTDECRRIFAERAELAVRLLRHHLPTWELAPPAGGLSLWVRIPVGTADAFAAVAAKHSVTFLAGGAASVDDAHPDRLRLSFAETPERLREAIVRLRRAWADYVPDSSHAGAVRSLG